MPRDAWEPRSSSGRPACSSHKRLFAPGMTTGRTAIAHASPSAIAPSRRSSQAAHASGAQDSSQPPPIRGLAKNLLKCWPALWTFASVPGVEPTNNQAERGLRGAVIYRKLSLGSSPRRRAHHRALALGLDHLPPAETLAV